MPKQYRLKGAEFRAWRTNTPQLVDSEGVPVRALSVKEEECIVRATEIAERTRQNTSKKEVVPDPDTESKKRELKIDVRVQPLPDGSVRTYVKVDGMERRTARELICANILKLNKGADTQVKGPNNKFLKYVRNPEALRPQRADADRTVPKPEFCQCRGWGEPHPGVHHKICKFNKYAPRDEQAPGTAQESLGVSKDLAVLDATPPTFEDLSPVLEPELESVPKPTAGGGILAGIKTHAPGLQPVADGAKPVPPEGCQCEGWVRPEGQPQTGHHYMCEHKDAWERHVRQQEAASTTPHWLLDKEGNQIRKATPEEIAQSEQTKTRTGLSTIEVEGEKYTIVEKAKEHAPDAVETFYLVDMETGEVLRKADSEEVESSTRTEETIGLRSVEVDGKTYAVQSETQAITKEETK